MNKLIRKTLGILLILIGLFPIVYMCYKLGVEGGMAGLFVMLLIVLGSMCFTIMVIVLCYLGINLLIKGKSKSL